jgi:hypothetical protein
MPPIVFLFNHGKWVGPDTQWAPCISFPVLRALGDVRRQRTNEPIAGGLLLTYSTSKNLIRPGICLRPEAECHPRRALLSPSQTGLHPVRCRCRCFAHICEVGRRVAVTKDAHCHPAVLCSRVLRRGGRYVDLVSSGGRFALPLDHLTIGVKWPAPIDADHFIISSNNPANRLATQEPYDNLGTE